MSRVLKDLMNRATDRPSPHVPDLDQLLRAGNRAVRKRRLVVSLATAAAVAVIAGGITVALSGSTPSQPAPAGTPTQDPVNVSTICEPTKWTPPRYPSEPNADRYPEVIVLDEDADGTAAVRRSADGREIGFCATWFRPVGSTGALGSSGAYRGGFVTEPYKVHKFEAPGCGTATRVDCNGFAYGFAGRLPQGVARITAEGGGLTEEAVVKDGYYAVRLYIPRALGKGIRTTVSMYDSSGRLVWQL